jgi:hypothetical protein
MPAKQALAFRYEVAKASIGQLIRSIAEQRGSIIVAVEGTLQYSAARGCDDVCDGGSLARDRCAH